MSYTIILVGVTAFFMLVRLLSQNSPGEKKHSAHADDGKETSSAFSGSFEKAVSTIFKEGLSTLEANGEVKSGIISPVPIIAHSKDRDAWYIVNDNGKDEYDFTIILSEYTLSSSERSLYNTLYHELLHTIPNAMGTLMCETAPYYFNWMLFFHRYLHDDSFSPEAEDRKTAAEMEEYVLANRASKKEWGLLQ